VEGCRDLARGACPFDLAQDRFRSLLRGRGDYPDFVGQGE
jgi:hypothetical protein